MVRRPRRPGPLRVRGLPFPACRVAPARRATRAAGASTDCRNAHAADRCHAAELAPAAVICRLARGQLCLPG
eukprot:3350733-Alexandrium_andersonii.AAC.1